MHKRECTRTKYHAEMRDIFPISSFTQKAKILQATISYFPQSYAIKHVLSTTACNSVDNTSSTPAHQSANLFDCESCWRAALAEEYAETTDPVTFKDCFARPTPFCVATHMVQKNPIQPDEKRKNESSKNHK